MTKLKTLLFCIFYWERKHQNNVTSKRKMLSAPSLYAITTRKNRTVRQALARSAWITDLRRNISEQHLVDFVQLFVRVTQVSLTPEVPDDIIWKWTSTGIYTAQSAYRAQFLGSIHKPFVGLIWDSWGPQKCKIFAWLAIQERLPTADILTKRHMTNDFWCPLCTNNPETAQHLLISCGYTKRV